jgi:hypothetical protein
MFVFSDDIIDANAADVVEDDDDDDCSDDVKVGL